MVHEVGLHLPGGVGRGELALAVDGVGVAPLLGEVREAVVQVLGGLAHDQGRLVDDPLADDPRVRVDALTHGVAAHVLDSTGDGDVDGPETDRGGHVRDGGHRTGAHAVDRVARGGLGQAREQAGQATQRQPLVADLRGGGDRDLFDPFLGQFGVASQQFTHALDDEVVGAGLGVDALLAGFAERGADAVDEDDFLEGTGHGGGLLGHGGHGAPGCRARPRQRTKRALSTGGLAG